jgi:SNF2 family DNA or RNA helicase
VYRLVAKDTAEERIVGLQERKPQLAEIAVGVGVPAGELTREELMVQLGCCVQM